MLDFENMPFFCLFSGFFFCFFFYFGNLLLSNMTYCRIYYSKQVVVLNRN